MIRSPRPFAALTLAAVALLSLSGCVLSQPTPADDTPKTASPSPTPSAEAPDDEPTDGSGASLTFDGGNDLAVGDSIQWGDGFLGDEGWDIASADDGNGRWSYQTIDRTCTVTFWQGTVGAELATTPGDDLASTDALLAFVLSKDAAAVADAAQTGEFSYQLGGEGSVDNRQVFGGGEGGRGWILSARVFTSADIGLWRMIDCTGSDPSSVYLDVDDKSPVIVLPKS
jgi:hypothetical protein